MAGTLVVSQGTEQQVAIHILHRDEGITAQPADSYLGAASHMATTYETICEFLESQEIQFQRHEGGTILVQYDTEKYRDPQGEANVLVVTKLENDGRFLKIFVPNAFSYHDGPYKAVVLQAALFVNFCSKMLQFEYDPRDGEIRAMVEFPLADSPLTEEQFFHAFHGLCGLVEEYSPFIHHAMHGTLDAATSGTMRSRSASTGGRYLRTRPGRARFGGGFGARCFGGSGMGGGSGSYGGQGLPARFACRPRR